MPLATTAINIYPHTLAIALNKSENKEKRRAKEVGGREMEQQPDQMVTKDFISGIDKKECYICHATETPQNHWRSGPEGPNGPKILCNACGLRYHDQRKKINKQNSFKKKINTNLTLGPTPNRK